MESTDNASWSQSGELGADFSCLGGKSEEANPQARRQAAVLAFGRRTNAQPPLSILMQDAVALVAEILRADISAVGEVVEGGDSLALRAVMGVGQPESDASTHQYPLVGADSMAAFAINSASPALCDNLETEQRFKDPFLRNLGVLSAITVPLHVAGKTYGTLGIYAAREKAFASDDAGFAETIAYLLSSSIARIKMETELSQQRDFSSTVLDIVEALVVAVDIEGNLLSINRACQRIARFSVAEIRGKPFWDIFVVPKELDFVRGIFRNAEFSKGPSEFESLLLTKDGDQRQISWSLKLMRDSYERPRSVVMTGIDRTGQLQTETELHKLKGVAERATRALEKLRDERNDAGRKVVGPKAADEQRAENSQSESRPFQPLGENRGAELRTSQRRAYQYGQMIAPVYGTTLPTEEDLLQVECRDISAGGIAFLLDQSPDFENLVVALGRAPSLIYFTAKVARVATVEEDERTAYLVGCRFTGRTKLENA